MITGAFDQTTAAALRLAPAFGNTSDRIEFASRAPSPAPVIWPRQPSFSPAPASRTAAVTARSPAAISAAISDREVRPDVERQLHAGLTSIVQTSRSRSRTGSPWTTKAFAVDHDPVPRPRVRDLGDTDVEPRRLRPEPRAAELGDRVGPPGDHADGDRLPVRWLPGRIAPEARIGEEPVHEAGEGGHRSEAPLSRTRPTISSAPAPTASTATPMSVLPEATLVARFAVLSQ